VRGGRDGCCDLDIFAPKVCFLDPHDINLYHSVYVEIALEAEIARSKSRSFYS
jgi:hypothetical protein